MKKYFKKGIWDRYDGWRVRNVDAVFHVIPYLLRTRNDSQNLFEDNIPLEKLEAFIREKKAQIPNLSIMHILMAATVRMLSQKPYLNRFIIWNKIYARNHISISLTIKRKESGEETIVKPEFEPEDTLYDVARKINEEISQNIGEGAENDADSISKLFGKLPSPLIRFIVWLLFKLDNIGQLPKSLHKVSPWHCSVFLTNVGSLGIDSIYHHLYEFGTCSMFVAMGKKTKVKTIDNAGNEVERKYIGLKFVADERICDGQYYATCLKMLRRMLLNPDVLLTPPEDVIVDDGVGKPRIA